MKAIVALIVALLAFPASARNEHGPWWDCVATYLSQNTAWLSPESATNPYINLLRQDETDRAARGAQISCWHLSLRTPSEDLDTVKETMAHFRRLAATPGAPPAFTRPRQ